MRNWKDKLILENSQNKNVIDCGDDICLCIFENFGKEEEEPFLSALAEQNPQGKIVRSQICANIFWSLETETGYWYAEYIPCRSQFRLMKAGSGRLLPEWLGEKKRYSGVQSITQITPDAEAKNFGMCYVIALGEGHFLLYDGLGNAGNDEEKIYQTIRSETPREQLPVIDAWILTHPHYDHIAGVAKFAQRYAQKVKVLNFVMNMPEPRQFPVRLWKEVADFYAVWMPAIRAMFPETSVWKVHTGQSFSVGSAVVEILFTQEEIYPEELTVVNDTSLVTRVFLNGKRLLFPADISGQKACLLIHDMYGPYLRSEYYQIAHHAWDTEALLFYGDVDPQTLFWPLRLRDWCPDNRMWTFPATKVMKREMEEHQRTFLIARDQNIRVEL